MDMVAGLEHIGRGTARRMDAMLVVIEPRMKSVDTVKRILRMAKEIEVETVLAADIGTAYLELDDGANQLDVTDSPGPSFNNVPAN